jgi:hypothetical protein
MRKHGYDIFPGGQQDRAPTKVVRLISPPST